MIISNNPFTSSLYIKKWLSNFYNGKDSYKFNFIEGLEFTKNKYLPLYYNVGKYKSCGISYNLSTSKKAHDFKNKVFLIYDVPDYFLINTSRKIKELGIEKIPQYEGYLIELDKYENINCYLESQFNSKQRYPIVSKLKKLEKSFNISYELYFGENDPKILTSLFNKLHDLIEIKFKNKKNNNSHTKPDIWKWYNDLIPKMIDEKKASFFVVKNNDEPIALALNYHSDDIFFYAVPATDSNFSKFGIGNIKLLKSIEWALNNGYSYFDIGKGSYGYKHKWAKKYYYEYHILYDKKSIISSIIANFLIAYYRLKQLIRTLKNNYASS